MSRIPVTGEPLSAEEKRGLRFEIPAVEPVTAASSSTEFIPSHVRRQFRDTTVLSDAEMAARLRPDAVLINSGESILQEAQRLTHGPRQADYGHPLDDYTRTAALVSVLLAHKLKEPLTAEETALAMCCVKLSRQVHAPKRDNMTDLAGYAWVSWACKEERERRTEISNPVSTTES